MRSYELMFVLDPRLSDDEVKTLVDEYKSMIEGQGAMVIRVEDWGRRKLAYEILKLKEGRYYLFYVLNESGGQPLAEVEHRMGQNDKVLRYLSVRTDEELKRAGLPLPVEEPESPAEPEADSAAAEEVA